MPDRPDHHPTAGLALPLKTLAAHAAVALLALAVVWATMRMRPAQLSAVDPTVGPPHPLGPVARQLPVPRVVGPAGMVNAFKPSLRAVAAGHPAPGPMPAVLWDDALAFRDAMGPATADRQPQPIRWDQPPVPAPGPIVVTRHAARTAQAAGTPAAGDGPLTAGHVRVTAEAGHGAEAVTAGAFMGVSPAGDGRAPRSIVYVIDASGSLIDTFPFVMQELSRSITSLTPDQQFTVLFFQRGRVTELPDPGLKRADAQTIRQARQWLAPGTFNVVPGGRTDPVSALRIAMNHQPEAVFLLSDSITGHGRHQIDQELLLADIDRHNTAQTRVHTIQFLYPDPLADGTRLGPMARIAQQTGGFHRFISEDELLASFAEVW
jgi:hypothetical protein